MKFWITKENDLRPHDFWYDAYEFTLNRDEYSTIFSSLATTWYHLDQLSIQPLYEDLFVLGLSIFSIDKRLPRRLFADCWTREIEVSIPVLELDNWMTEKEKIEQALKFLTGDLWNIEFRQTTAVYSYHKNKNRVHNSVDGCNCVSLFSGGLDSFCGAIKLLRDGMSPCLIGHNEYPRLREKQATFAKEFQALYPDQKVKFISFSANSRAPKMLDNTVLNGNENTSRGRSLLFICAAVTIAGIIGKNTPVFIPENGFVGLNLPLTDSRKGSCSTRTTHPYFIRLVNSILATVGIDHEIVNFFAYSTKREIVDMVKNEPAFEQYFESTISCSHPCQARWNRTGSREYPINCGYCYPCLIRKSSTLSLHVDRCKYSYDAENYDFLVQFENFDKSSDLRAVLNAVYTARKSTDKDIIRKIKYTGILTQDEVRKFLRVYRSTMYDLEELFAKDPRYAQYLELENGKFD